MARILCSKRFRNPRVVLQPPALRQFVVRHRNDEDEMLITQVLALDEAEVRSEMERILDRSDFTVHELA